ncbi:cyclic nucleotide-binding domain-containing protein [Deltaproteobacteria bacterium TL4]
MIQRVFILQTVPLLSKLPINILSGLAPLLQDVYIKKNEVIFHKGDIGKSMYIIVEGRVRVHDGEKHISYLEKRDVFGELAVLSTEPRMASVTAVEDSQLFCLDQDILYEIMAENIEIARSVIQVLMDRFQ